MHDPNEAHAAPATEPGAALAALTERVDRLEALVDRLLQAPHLGEHGHPPLGDDGGGGEGGGGDGGGGDGGGGGGEGGGGGGDGS